MTGMPRLGCREWARACTAREESFQDDEDEDPALRAPSRAMTDYRTLRAAEQQNRYSTGRQYTSREPLPELEPAPTLRPTSALRRPTLAGITNEGSSLLFRDTARRYEINRESSPAYEKQASHLRTRTQLNVPSAARNPNNRNSIGGITELNRTVSLGGRRVRGSSIDQ